MNLKPSKRNKHSCDYLHELNIAQLMVLCREMDVNIQGATGTSTLIARLEEKLSFYHTIKRDSSSSTSSADNAEKENALQALEERALRNVVSMTRCAKKSSFATHNHAPKVVQSETCIKASRSTSKQYLVERKNHAAVLGCAQTLTGI